MACIGIVRQNELETGREALYPLRMTKHSPFRYVKTSPEIIHLAVILPPPLLVDHTRYFRHAPARLRIAANMFALARGYAAVCLLVPLRSAEGATQRWVWG